MFRNRRRCRLILLISAVCFLAACAGMTAKQRFTAAYGTHVRMVKNYNDQYDLQTPEVQEKWKAEIDPVLKKIDDAMAAWDQAQTSGVDTAAKSKIYQQVYDTLWNLFVKYGVKIKKEN